MADWSTGTIELNKVTEIGVPSDHMPQIYPATIDDIFPATAESGMEFTTPPAAPDHFPAQLPSLASFAPIISTPRPAESDASRRKSRKPTKRSAEKKLRRIKSAPATGGLEKPVSAVLVNRNQLPNLTALFRATF